MYYAHVFKTDQRVLQIVREEYFLDLRGHFYTPSPGSKEMEKLVVQHLLKIKVIGPVESEQNYQKERLS